MRDILFVLFFAVLLLKSVCGVAQVGQKVVSVVIYDAHNKPLPIPSLGVRHVLIFYPDPDHPSQNKEFRKYFKTHPIPDKNIDAYGVINLKDAPLLSNKLLRFMIRNEIMGTNAYVYTDPDGSISKAWKLGDINNKFVVMWINREGIIEFYKAGQLTDEEIEQVHALIEKYK